MSKETTAVPISEQSVPEQLRPAHIHDTLSSAEKVIDFPAQNLNATGTSLSRQNKDSKYLKPIEDFHLVDNKNRIFI